MKTAPILAFTLFASGAAYAACLPDPSNVSIRGRLTSVTRVARNTGKPYTYYVVESRTAYCMSGEMEDDSDTTPTKKIVVTSGTSSDASLAGYVGRFETVNGRLEGTNGGGPLLMYRSISP